jgi:NAD(P)-dependent dehydrogenase (short-subunit alcohol dehydrogenase family)
MARVFVTGSSTGLGLMAGELLVEQGHRVVLHARNQGRADETRRALPQAEAVVLGDLSSVAGARSVAGEVNRLGRFNAIIHNAGVGYREAQPTKTADGLPHVFAVNVLAPYILTALIERPDRLVYLSSGMHRSANARLDDLTWTKRAWNAAAAYAESKFLDVLIAFGVARRWPDVLSNALEPGWGRPAWAARARPTTSTRPIAPRSGSPSAMSRKRGSPASISVTCASARPTRRRPQSSCRTG